MRRLRVLHVCYDLLRGGIQSWLAHAFRHIDREAFDCRLMVFSAGPEEYDPVFRELGVEPIRVATPHRFWAHGPQFRRAIRDHGPFDIIHSHVGFSGIILREARRAGIPVRIAHSHNDKAYFRPAGWFGLKAAVLGVTNRWLDADATAGLGCSREAAEALFGPGWEQAPLRSVLYYGIDLEPYGKRHDVAELRESLGLPPGAKVVAHVGRFSEQKNHALLVRIAREVATRAPDVHFALAGGGELQPAIAEQVRAAGLTDRVHFVGVQSDVPRFLAAADLMLFPSLFEGLPLALLEAQAAGLPCVISATISPEVDVVRPHITRVGLDAPPAAWADAVLGRLAVPRPVPHAEALGLMAASPFNIVNSVRAVETVYRDQAGRHCTSAGPQAVAVGTPG